MYQQPRAFITANLASVGSGGSAPAGFLELADALATLIENSQPLTTAEKIAYVMQGLMPYLQRIQSKSLITQTLCHNLQLAPQLASLLLNTVLGSLISPSSPKRAMDDFLALVGDGLSASYYPTIDLSGSPVLSRVDATVDFNWGFGMPDPATTISARPFSVEWIGYVISQYTEIYTFYVLAGDGVRLWVNGQSLLPNDEWKDQLPNEHASLPITLTAGQLYQIKLDYYDHTASGVIQLSWSSSSTPKAVIPQSQLFSGAVMQSLAPVVSTYNLLYKTTLLVNTFPLTAAMSLISISMGRTSLALTGRSLELCKVRAVRSQPAAASCAAEH